jgi:hypothetical protein
MVSSTQKAVSAKIRKNYHEMRAGRLHSGSGALVRKRSQLIAISESQARKGARGGHSKHSHKKPKRK